MTKNKKMTHAGNITPGHWYSWVIQGDWLYMAKMPKLLVPFDTPALASSCLALQMGQVFSRVNHEQMHSSQNM